MKKRIISLILVCILVLISIPVQADGYVQSYINLMMGSDETQLNVTWYSAGEEASDVADAAIPSVL